MINKTKLVMGIVVGLVLAATVVTFLLDMPPSWDESLTVFRLSLIISSIFAVFYLGAASLFVLGLEAFRAAMQRAYVALAAGIVLIGLGVFQIPVINALDLWDTWWVASGGSGLPFVLAGLLIYFGARNFARLLKIKSWLMSPPIVIAAAVLTAIFVSILPHASSTSTEVELDLTNAIVIWVVALNACAAVLVLQVKQHITVIYNRALAWFLLALVVNASCMFAFVGYALLGFWGESAAYLPLNFVFTLNGLLFMKAGHVFARIKEY